MAYDDEELFDHQVTAWTVGQLRAALADLPDDLPVTVITAEEPGGNLAGPDQVVISASPWADVPGGEHDDVSAKLARGELHPDHFEIDCEFPSGHYYRHRR